MCYSFWSCPHLPKVAEWYWRMTYHCVCSERCNTASLCTRRPTLERKDKLCYVYDNCFYGIFALSNIRIECRVLDPELVQLLRGPERVRRLPAEQVRPGGRKFGESLGANEGRGLSAVLIMHFDIFSKFSLNNWGALIVFYCSNNACLYAVKYASLIFFFFLLSVVDLMLYFLIFIPGWFLV